MHQMTSPECGFYSLHLQVSPIPKLPRESEGPVVTAASLFFYLVLSIDRRGLTNVQGLPRIQPAVQTDRGPRLLSSFPENKKKERCIYAAPQRIPQQLCF